MNDIIFNNIIGNEIAKNELKKVLSNNSIPHSWLISGPRGIGKRKLIDSFLQEIFHDIPGAYEKIKQNIFMDYLEISPLDKKNITINEIKEINKFLSLTSGASKYRIVLIDSSESMNLNASNALLKILEEPPLNAIIILISHNADKLLPTIKSRCRHIKMNPLSKAECEEILQDVMTENEFRICNGSIGLALEVREHKILDLYLELLEVAVSNDMQKLFKIIETKDFLSNQITWRLMGTIIIFILNNIVKFLSSENFRKELEKKEFDLLNKIVKNHNLNEWISILEEVNKLFYECNLLNFDKKHILIVIFNLIKK